MHHRIKPTTERIKKISGTVLTVAAALFVLVCGVLVLLLPTKTVSEAENRALQGKPVFSVEKLLSGKLGREIADYCADQFPARSFFTSVKATAELGAGKLENNGVIFGKNDTLLSRLEYSAAETETLSRNVSALDLTVQSLRAKNVPAAVMIVPRAVDVARDALPRVYSETRQQLPHAVIADGLNATDAARYSALEASLLDAAAQGTAVWFKTDHHWTVQGAYIAYQSLGDALGYEARPASFFTFETVSDSFLGTTFSSSGMVRFSPEPLSVVTYPGIENVTVNVIGGDGTVESSGGIYAWDALDTRDKYSVFMGGNFARAEIRHTDGVYPKLLVFKDSFFNSLAPFLSLHFDMDVIDMRYFRGDFSALLAQTQPDAVLLTWGLDELAHTDYKKIMLLVD